MLKNTEFVQRLSLVAGMLTIFACSIMPSGTAAQAGLALGSKPPGLKVINKHATVVLRPPEVLSEIEGEFAIEFEVLPEWHIYWINPGDSGEEPRFDFTDSRGISVGTAEFPIPKRIPAGPFVNFGYDSSYSNGQKALPISIRFPVRASDEALSAGETDSEIHVAITYLVCKQECVPEKARLSARAPIKKGDALSETRLTDDTQFPPREGKGSAATPIQGRFRLGPGILELETPVELKTAAGDLEVFASAGVPLKASDGGRYDNWYLRVAIDESAAPMTATSFRALLVTKSSRQGYWVEFHNRREFDIIGLLKMLGLAFIGGLILNLMPCVFPVVSLKVLSFVNEASGSKREQRAHALAYAFGVLLSLWTLVGALLAVRAAGTAVGWGFQLQSPIFIMGLFAVFLLLSFNLLGFFEIEFSGPGFLQKYLSMRGKSGSFMTGLLTTVVATPCSAPFMGVAIGSALASGVFEAIAVFTALGLGLAVPYVALGFAPRLLKWLPRPGVWMERLKEFLAFPLLLTAVWLLWVLAQTSPVASIVAVLVWSTFLSLFVWAVYRKLSTTKWVTLAALIATSIITYSVVKGGADDFDRSAAAETQVDGWVPYSDAALESALRDGKSVFVDFTASWCVTCQINKKLVLTTEAGSAAFRTAGVVKMRADWTKRDSEISNALARLGRNSVPVYAYYEKGNRKPTLLPELLTLETVREAIGADVIDDGMGKD